MEQLLIILMTLQLPDIKETESKLYLEHNEEVLNYNKLIFDSLSKILFVIFCGEELMIIIKHAEMGIF